MTKAAKKAKAERRIPGSAAATLPKVDFAAARAFAASHLPGAEVVQKFGNASFSIAGKVFAFTRSDGLVLKLPPEALAHLCATREAEPLVMGKRVMREWAHLQLHAPRNFREEIALLNRSMAYVEQLGQI